MMIRAVLDENPDFTNDRRLQIQLYIKKGENDKAIYHLSKIKNRDFDKNSGKTLLHYSVEYENLVMVQYLIESGWDVNVRDDSGDTPLQIAAKKKTVEIFELLLQNDADIYKSDCFGRSILHRIATICLCIEPHMLFNCFNQLILEKLFDKINNDWSTDRLTMSQLLIQENYMVKFACVVFGNEDMCRFFLKNDRSTDYNIEDVYGHSPLHWTIYSKKLKNAKLLIEHGANVNVLNKLGYSPLYYYAEYFQKCDMNQEILKLLLYGGMNRKYKSLERLLQYGNKQTVTVVLQTFNKFPLFEYNRNFLHLLATNEDGEAIEAVDEVLIEYDINAGDVRGATALTIAIVRKHVKQVEFLLDHGAKITFDMYKKYSLADDLPKPSYFKGDELCKIVQLLLQYNIVVEKNFIDYLGKLNFFKPIVAHLALIEKIDQRVLVENYYVIYKYGDHFDIYTKQLRLMERIKVHENVTLYQLLADNQAKLMIYVHRENFIEAFNRIMENLPFESYYTDTLHWRINRAVKQNELSLKAGPMLGELIGLNNDTYYFIICKICGYLDVNDLRNLCILHKALLMKQ